MFTSGSRPFAMGRKGLIPGISSDPETAHVDVVVGVRAREGGVVFAYVISAEDPTTPGRDAGLRVNGHPVDPIETEARNQVSSEAFDGPQPCLSIHVYGRGHPARADVDLHVVAIIRNRQARVSRDGRISERRA